MQLSINYFSIIWTSPTCACTFAADVIFTRTQRYKAFHLNEVDITATIKQVQKTIEYAEWLAKAAEDELLRYGEFVRWFRSGESFKQQKFSWMLTHSFTQSKYGHQKACAPTMDLGMSCAR